MFLLFLPSNLYLKYSYQSEMNTNNEYQFFVIVVVV